MSIYPEICKENNLIYPVWITAQMDERKAARERKGEKKKGKVKTLMEFVN